MTTKLRIVRLLVYEGRPETVEYNFARRAVVGQKVWDTNTITEAILSRSYIEETGLPTESSNDQA
jgi:hypothetical protein